MFFWGCQIPTCLFANKTIYFSRAKKLHLQAERNRKDQQRSVENYFFNKSCRIFKLNSANGRLFFLETLNANYDVVTKIQHFAAMLRDLALPVAGGGGITETEVRKNFPEVWLWLDLNAG